MYHGYASLKKEHFLPVFTEKRALFQHILREAKSTKYELKEHLWERAKCGESKAFIFQDGADVHVCSVYNGSPACRVQTHCHCIGSVNFIWNSRS